MKSQANSQTKTQGKSNPTRERLIEAARELFLVQGFQATSLAEVLKEAGVNSGSLYYFFKSKNDLLLAVLSQYVELLHPLVIDPVFEQVEDPVERVFGILAGYRKMLEMTDCRMGCPIGNLALEMSEKNEEVRLGVAQNFTNWCDAIRKCLDDAHDRFPTNVNRADIAQFILTVMEGGVMQAKAFRSIEPFDVSIAALRDYINRLLADGEREKKTTGESS